ncbi:MAG: hypothetical protein GY856_54815 [bacterium]|nr:hypothetical protein [bacterium]
MTLASSPEWIVLRLELPVVEHRSYRVTLLAADGTVIWQRHGLVPDPHDALVVSLYSPLLDPGDHVLRLEGVAAQGSAVAAGEFRFHVARRR